MPGTGRWIAPALILLGITAGCAAKSAQPEMVAPVDLPVVITAAAQADPAGVADAAAADVAPLADEGTTAGDAAPHLPDHSAAVEPAQPTELPVAEPPSPKKKKVELLTAYLVRGGESLWSIAARRDVYGDALLWPLLYQANRDQIMDPRQIFVGQQLSIPRGLAEKDFEEARVKARESKVFPLDLLLKK